MGKHAVIYLESSDGIGPEQLGGGFFEGWPNPPSQAAHLRLLQASYAVRLAVDEGSSEVVGFVNAISDGVYSAYLPMLEVLPAYRRRGIGAELMRRMLESLSGMYMIDLTSASEAEGFYRRLGMQPAAAMMIRNYARQSGEGA